MPEIVGGAIAYAFGAAGAGATAFTVAGVAVTYTTIGTAVILAGSVAYSSSQNSKLRRALGTAGIDSGRSVMARDPIAARRLIYGRVRVSGTIVFLHTTGTKNEYLHLVVVLAGHEVDDIGDIYFNDELVELSGNIPIGKYSAVARINKKRGVAGDTADSDLVAETGGLWTTDHKLSGCAYLAVRLKWSPDLFPNGLPTITAVVRGKKVYDPRTATTAWSDNAALCVGDFLRDATWGKGVALGRIRAADWQEAANLCDENVVLNDPQSKTGDVASGNRHIGCADCSGILPGYRVTGSGIPSGAQVVSVDPSGTFFTIDRDPTATNATTALTLGAGESRYTINGIVTADQAPQEVLGDMAGAMAGHIVDTGGLWTIRAGAWRTPALTLTDADLCGALSVQPRQSRQDTFNGVKGVFVSPANDWAPADFPAVKNDTYMAADGGVRLWLDVQYNFTTSPATAQRLAKIELERGRQQITVSGRYMLKAMQCMPGDVIAVQRGRLGWAPKYFEVVEWTFEPAGTPEAPTLAVALSLRETAAGVWDWADGEETTIDLAPNTTLPNPFAVPTLSGLTLTSDTIVQTDGTVLPRFRVQWSTPNNIYVEQGGQVVIEFKPSTSSTWVEWASVRGDLLEDMITGVVIGLSYNVRARFVNSQGVRGSYSSTATVAVTGDTSAPSAPTGLTAIAGTGKAISLAWNANTEDDFSEYRIYRRITSPTVTSFVLIAETGANRFVDVDVTIGSTYEFKVGAVDTSENESAASGTASATPSAPSGGSVPSNPSALTFDSSATYVAGDGTVFGYISVSVPAMPAGAIVQNLLYKRNGAANWKIAAQLTNATTQVVRVDDLSSDTSWDFALQAHNGTGSSTVVNGTSIPYSVSNTSTVTAPASGSLTADNSQPAVKSDFTDTLFGCRVAWAAVTQKDISYYQVKATATDSDGAVDYTWFAGDGVLGLINVPKDTTYVAIYNATLTAGRVRVRAVNTTGNASAWLSLGNANGAAIKTIKDMALQASSDVTVTGIKTGASTNKVARRHPVRGTYALAGGGGGTTDTINLSLSGAGFTVAPDVGKVQSDNTTAYVRYDWDDSSSTTAVLRVRSLDGGALPATMNIDGEFIDYV